MTSAAVLRTTSRIAHSSTRATLLAAGGSSLAGTIELLCSGALPADFWDWRDGANFSFGGRRCAAVDAAAAAVEERSEDDDEEEGAPEEAEAAADGATNGASSDATASSGQMSGAAAAWVPRCILKRAPIDCACN